MAVFTTSSALATEKLGEKIALKLPKRVIALSGELGSGKTTFVKGLARGLGAKGRIISPSFVLIRQYSVYHHRYTKLYHIDLYRLEKKEEFQGLGLEEIINNPYNIVVIEWAEKIKEILPKKTLWVKFQYQDKNKRKIEIQ